jgi:hypothetical protein
MSDMHCGRLHVRPALVLRGFFVILQMHVQTNLDRQRGSCCYGKDGPRERGRVQGSGDEDGVKGTTLERMGAVRCRFLLHGLPPSSEQYKLA